MKITTERIGVFCAVAIFLAGCGAETEPAKASPSPSTSSATEPTSKNDFSDIISIFEQVPGTESVSVSDHGKTLLVVLHTNLGEEIPEDWSAKKESFSDALMAASETDTSQEYADIGVQMESSNASILLSGYSGSIKFDVFEKAPPAKTENSPTITASEYEKIYIGMPMSDVKDLIGGSGELQVQIGSAENMFGMQQTYRWYGEEPGSYADIIFDNYKVFYKVEVFLT